MQQKMTNLQNHIRRKILKKFDSAATPRASSAPAGAVKLPQWMQAEPDEEVERIVKQIEWEQIWQRWTSSKFDPVHEDSLEQMKAQLKHFVVTHVDKNQNEGMIL